MIKRELIEMWARLDTAYDARFAMVRQYLKIRGIAAEEYLKAKDPKEGEYYLEEMDGCNAKIAELFKIISDANE